MNQKYRMMITNLITYALVVIAYLGCQALIKGDKISMALEGQLVPICVYIVLAVSLNLTVGVSGELSLGHAGFMYIGAISGITVSMWLRYTIDASPDFIGFLESIHLDPKLFRIIISLIVGGIFAGIAGFLIGIPVLRLRGDYLAIVTLAFGEIIRNVMTCLYIDVNKKTGALHFAFNNADQLSKDFKAFIKGPTGITGTSPKTATFAVGFALVLFALFIVLKLINSRTGRAIRACRDNRIAAEAMGLNVTKYKMIAFVTSAVLAGMAGALYAGNLNNVAPNKFNIDTSILILVFVVLGGLGNILGSVISASVLTLLPELLREFNDYRMLVYAIVLILTMLITNSPIAKRVISFLREQLKKPFGKLQKLLTPRKKKTRHVWSANQASGKKHHKKAGSAGHR